MRLSEEGIRRTLSANPLVKKERLKEIRLQSQKDEEISPKLSGMSKTARRKKKNIVQRKRESQ